MTRFSHSRCFTQSDSDVLEFVADYFAHSRKTLFIGTVGIQPSSLFLPVDLFATKPGVDFKFIIEKRREVSAVLQDVGKRHAEFLETNISSNKVEFSEVDIVAKDGATIAGRNAVSKADPWYTESYTDIVIDATGMSRGVCFPLVQQAIGQGLNMGANVHLFVASDDEPVIQLRSESNDRAEWMHGFQQNMGLDSTSDALKLWVPQLSENAIPQMRAMFQQLSTSSSIAEVCPIVPFPSLHPRRGDDLLFEFEDMFRGDWESSHLNIIHAHESNPLDVFDSIEKMATARKEVFGATNQKAVTVLSPLGWRIGSLGMLLAAIDLGLPMLYVETIGYTTPSSLPTAIEIKKPDRLWHILLAGAPYANKQLYT